MEKFAEYDIDRSVERKGPFLFTVLSRAYGPRGLCNVGEFSTEINGTSWDEVMKRSPTWTPGGSSGTRMNTQFKSRASMGCSNNQMDVDYSFEGVGPVRKVVTSLSGVGDDVAAEKFMSGMGYVGQGPEYRPAKKEMVKGQAMAVLRALGLNDKQCDLSAVSPWFQYWSMAARNVVMREKGPDHGAGPKWVSRPPDVHSQFGSASGINCYASSSADLSSNNGWVFETKTDWWDKHAGIFTYMMCTNGNHYEGGWQKAARGGHPIEAHVHGMTGDFRRIRVLATDYSRVYGVGDGPGYQPAFAGLPSGPIEEGGQTLTPISNQEMQIVGDELAEVLPDPEGCHFAAELVFGSMYSQYREGVAGANCGESAESSAENAFLHRGNTVMPGDSFIGAVGRAHRKVDDNAAIVTKNLVASVIALMSDKKARYVASQVISLSSAYGMRNVGGETAVCRPSVPDVEAACVQAGGVPRPGHNQGAAKVHPTLSESVKDMGCPFGTAYSIAAFKLTGGRVSIHSSHMPLGSSSSDAHLPYTANSGNVGQVRMGVCASQLPRGALCGSLSGFPSMLYAPEELISLTENASGFAGSYEMKGVNETSMEEGERNLDVCQGIGNAGHLIPYLAAAVPRIPAKAIRLFGRSVGPDGVDGGLVLPFTVPVGEMAWLDASHRGANEWKAHDAGHSPTNELMMTPMMCDVTAVWGSVLDVSVAQDGNVDDLLNKGGDAKMKRPYFGHVYLPAELGSRKGGYVSGAGGIKRKAMKPLGA